jgi:hypothetical protein
MVQLNDPAGQIAAAAARLTPNGIQGGQASMLPLTSRVQPSIAALRIRVRAHPLGTQSEDTTRRLLE